MLKINQIITDYQLKIKQYQMERFEHLINILETNDCEAFLKIDYYDYSFINQATLIDLINAYNDWLTNPNNYQDIITNNLYYLLDINIFQDYHIWINILKDNEKGFIDKLNLPDEIKIPFDKVINNDILLQLSLTKLDDLRSLYNKVDLRKLDKQRYLNELRYLPTLIITDRKVIKLIDKRLLNDKDIFKAFQINHYDETLITLND